MLYTVVIMTGIVIVAGLVISFYFNPTGSSQAKSSSSGLTTLRFAAVGDFGCTPDSTRTIQNIEISNPQLVLALGDFSYKETGDCWLDLVKPIKDRTKIVIGNHEIEESPLLEGQYMSAFGLSNQFYSFEAGNVHFLVMSTETDFTRSSEQYKFVTSDLQSASANPNTRWIIVCLHGYMYASAGAVTHLDPTLRDIYHPLFEKYRVDLVLSGHEHNYQRTYPLRYNLALPSVPTVTDGNLSSYTNPSAPVFVIVGTGGINLYTLPEKAPYIAEQGQDFGYLEIDASLDGSELRANFHSNDGKFTDNFVIEKHQAVNNPPVANAGASRSVLEGSRVILDGSASFDPDQDYPLKYLWKQTGGAAIILDNPDSAKPSFQAPAINSDSETFSFSLNVVDARGKPAASSSSVSVTEIKNPYTFAPYLTLNGTNYFDLSQSGNNQTNESSLALQQFTVSAWFNTKMKLGNGSAAMLVARGAFGHGAPMNYGLWLSSGDRVGGGFETLNGTEYFINSPNDYGDGLWHFATLTDDGQQIRLYVDGSQVGARSTGSNIPVDSPSQHLRIGADSNIATRSFVGNIDEVRIWNRAISPSEVTDAYILGRIDTSGQILYLPFS